MNTITISREFGSGGREVGKRLADALGYKYFDTEIIQMVAKEAGFDPDYVSSLMEKPNYSIHYSSTFTIIPEYDNFTKILLAQRKVMNEITSKYNCVIVGRGANFMNDAEKNFSIFVHASEESKLKRCLDRSNDPNETVKTIKKKMKIIDKNRARFSSMYFGRTWGDKDNYDLIINTSNIEIKSIIPAIKAYVEAYFLSLK